MIVLAVDPGRSKCGVAVIDDERLLHRAVVPREDMAEEISEVLARFVPSECVVGKGTGAQQLVADLLPVLGGLQPVLVDERYTSLDARRRYFRENPPKGLLRLVPRGLLTPRVPIDDYAALILAEEYIRSSRSKRQ